MRLSDLIVTDLPRAAPDNFIRDTATYMLASEVKALPVCAGERLVGILTDWDIAPRSPATTTRARSRSAGLISKPVLTVRADATLEEVSRLMGKYHLHHVRVSDGERFEGMVYLDVDWAGVDHEQLETPRPTFRRML